MKKKYKIIYSDPPWSYRVYSEKGKGRAAENHYNTMRLEDIKEMDVQSIADDDCILFLWVTWPNLIEGIETMQAWGFKYKTCGFLWAKINKKSDSLFTGLGFWTRANTEACIIGTKGSPRRIDKGVHQVVIKRIGRHSEKPACVRDRIVRLMGDLPRLEMFARQRVKGWDSHGNVIKNGVKIHKRKGTNEDDMTRVAELYAEIDSITKRKSNGRRKK